MGYARMALGLAMAGIAAAPATAADARFGMSYHVERADAARLDVGRCLAAAERASGTLGFVTAVRQVHPGQLGVLSSGPRAGGGSLTVYCIASERRTIAVVQALDYTRPDSIAAQRTADAVRGAILRAASR